MNHEVRKELDTLLTMVSAWKDEKVRTAGDDMEGNDFLVSDLAEEIEEHVYPYARRMYECKYITGPELSAFIDQCYQNVASLRDYFGVA